MTQPLVWVLDYDRFPGSVRCDYCDTEALFSVPLTHITALVCENCLLDPNWMIR